MHPSNRAPVRDCHCSRCNHRRTVKRDEKRRKSRAVRQALLDRDGLICQWCSEPLGDVLDSLAVHVDHVDPVYSTLGRHDRYNVKSMGNLRLLHGTCNLERRYRAEHETDADEAPF